MAEFKQSIDYVLENEGGYCVDSGGPTNFGIVIGDVAAFRGIPSYAISAEDMQELTKDEAEQIYKKLYWDHMGLDQVLDQNVATALFDTAVNRGIGTLAKYAQRTCILLGFELMIDGRIGPATIAAINACARAKFIPQLADIDIRGYDNLIIAHPDLAIYRDGWENRAKRLLMLA